MPDDDPFAPDIRETDLGNARRLVRAWGRHLRYVAAWRRWLVWDNTRWAPDLTLEVGRMAKAVIREIYGEAQDETDAARRRALAAHALRSESKGHLEAIVSLAESEHGITIAPADLDRDPWLLNCQNGTIDLRSGVLRPHTPADLISRSTGTVYEPAAEHDTWRTFLERILPDPALRSFAQRAAGYSLTGLTREEVLFFVHGPEASGKSTFLAALRHAAGEYSVTADFSTFTSSDHPGIRDDIARLAGARMVVALEAAEGDQLNEALIKLASGGDPISARRLYEHTFEFVPQFKIWLVANIRPRARHEDAAIWRRLLELPFLVSIPEGERDQRLKERLAGEEELRQAVLAWAVCGAVEWATGGLGRAPAVLEASAAYRRSMDPLADFLREACVILPGEDVRRKDLRDAYMAWCLENGLGKRETLGAKRFNQRLEAAGMSRHVVRNGSNLYRVWRGLRLMTKDDVPADEPEWIRE